MRSKAGSFLTALKVKTPLELLTMSEFLARNKIADRNFFTRTTTTKIL